MPEITLRPQRLSDAKRFFEILNNDHFVYFSSRPKSLKEEINFLKENPNRRRKNLAHNFTILFGKAIVGGCGLSIDQRRPHIGEIGYFVDENYWGLGIASEAVRLLEKIGFQKLKLQRMEIRMNPKNKGSQRVALKNGYKKEGRLRKEAFSKRDKAYHDSYLYAKVK